MSYGLADAREDPHCLVDQLGFQLDDDDLALLQLYICNLLADELLLL